MKKRIPPFLSGMLTMVLIGGMGVTALAATGQMTITVDPINIQVNGQTFQPKDAQGNDVPVFAYNGTTYAPLRPLAEAYGLTVGYDQEANMATVGAPTPDTTAAPETLTAADYSDWTAVDGSGKTHIVKLFEGFKAILNGKEYATDEAPYLLIDVGGKCYVNWNRMNERISGLVTPEHCLTFRNDIYVDVDQFATENADIGLEVWLSSDRAALCFTW